jgi:hypothetical protein
MIAIAAAVAKSLAEATVESGRKALGALVGLIKRRFASEPSAQAALDAAQQDPAANTPRLAAALSLVAAGDAEFDARLRREWGKASTQITTGDGSIVNSVSGMVDGSVIQIGRMDGNSSLRHDD